MSKGVRIVIGLIFLIGLALLARNQLALAGSLPAQSAGSVAQSRGVSAQADIYAQRGSVKPPPVVVPPIHTPGTYSAGGVCTVIVDSIAPDVGLHVILLPFSTVHNRPSEIKRYLAGVCNLTFVEAGKGVTDVTPADATVKVCFAAIPNTSNTIYIYDDKTWFPLVTTVQNGLACAPATKTGKYLLTDRTP